MQLLAFEVFRHRALYYWARYHQSQLPQGADYGIMRPTITMCFVNTRMFPELTAWHTAFELRERESGILFSDQMAIHVLELPKFTKAVQDLRTPLEKWMYRYLLCHGAELDPENLPVELEDPAIRHALGEMQMMTQSELERDRYEARVKWQRDYAAAMDDARREGEARGETRGAARMLVHQVQVYEGLLGQPVSPAEQLQQRPLAELQALAQALEEKLSASLPGKRSPSS